MVVDCIFKRMQSLKMRSMTWGAKGREFKSLRPDHLTSLGKPPEMAVLFFSLTGLKQFELTLETENM